MREISIKPVEREDYSDKLTKALSKAISEAVSSVKPPIIQNKIPEIIIPEQKMPEKEKGSYIIRVNRDDSGKVSTMVVSPYEPI